MNVSHDALFQNCINDSAPPNRRATRAPDNKSFIRTYSLWRFSLCIPDQFKKIINRYKNVGYNLDAMRQSACIVLNPIMVYNYGFLFNCKTVGQASVSMTART